MSHSMRFSSVFLVLVLHVVIGGCSTAPDRNGPPGESRHDGSVSARCGPSLSPREILGTACEALEIPSERALRREYEVSIEEKGCNYVFFAQRRDPVAVEPIRLVIDRTGRIINPPTCWWLGDLGNCPFPFGGDSLELGPLVSDCIVQKSWSGLSELPDAAWLVCGKGQPVLLTSPLNLLGKVQIRTAVQALQFVRFFSSPATHQLFPLGGMLELSASDDSPTREIADVLQDQARFHEPRIQSQTRNSFCVDSHARQVPCTRTTYTIERLAVFYDGSVYDLTEKVGEDGSYRLVTKSLVLEDVARFGFEHGPAAVAPPGLHGVPEARPAAPPP